jgi:diaminohydroxyphosphoribosylaminopyrimidine deaminase / 5-amino-6-(5-phosphoribosylamino)uracil reductase
MSETQIMQETELMRHALRLAMRGRGAVEPNPMVGCVIVKDGQIIGEGYHERFGAAHAEPRALAAAGEAAAGATAFVTMEPCCHLQKKTPPCVPKLINARLSRVVVGCQDPNPMVAGKGITQLRAAGMIVEEGLLAAECKQLNAAFFKRIDHRQPYVTLKWAQTADGKVAGPRNKRLYISNEKSWRVLHALRARCDAILVGSGTVLADDPILTARGIDKTRPLLRAVLDQDLRISPSSQLARTTSDGPVVVYCSQTVYHQRAAAVTALNAQGVEVLPLRADLPTGLGGSGSLSLTHLMNDLDSRGVTHLLVESGPTLAASFFQHNMADRVWIFRSPKKVGDAEAPNAPTIQFPAAGEVFLEGDRLTEYLNPGSSVYFATAPSADLYLAGK